jgi:pimeloyl-ACP methyl ester carboxylesterase
VAPGRQIAWRAIGDGPPLLLLNGYAGTAADWDPVFLGLLAAEHQVICPDNIGLGGSTLAAGETVGGVEGMTTDAVGLLDALDIERAALAGWSMGGFIAQSLARAAPERITSLALISTHPGGPDCVDGDPAAWFQLTDHSGTPREQATRLISLLFPSDRAPEAGERFGDLVAAARAALPEPVLFMQEQAIIDWHGRPASLAPLKPPLPTAVVQGGADIVVAPGNAPILAGLHWGAQVTMLPECAHAPMAQEPTAVAEAVLAVAAG